MVYLLCLILIGFFLLLNIVSGELSTGAFECGILNQEVSRNPFSFYFFYFTVLFLLFDVELCCLVPLLRIKILMASLLLIVVLYSTLVELKDGVLR